MIRGEQAMSSWSLRQLIWICLGTITMVFLVSAASSVIARGAVTRATDQLNQHLLPAQERVMALSKAYVDEETGQRGFMLTGNQVSLEPYVAGKTTADRLVAELDASLAGDGEASRRLNAAVAAAGDWVTEAAEPQIAARRAGSIPPDQLEAMTLVGKRQFDQLRVRLSALEARTRELIAELFDRVRAAQQLTNIANGAAALLLLAGAIISYWLSRQMLLRPVASVLQDVTAVARGDYDRTICSAGLREVAMLADAAETMRGTLRDQTAALGKANEEIRQLSITDELTGLHNRRGFYPLAEAALHTARRYGRGYLLAYLDIDGLKQINDEQGHGVGDGLLSDVAEVLRATMRRSDILARIGGDEFCILVPQPEGEPAVLRQRIFLAFRRFNETANRPYSLSASIGLVKAWPSDFSTLDELLAHADKLMYEEKKTKHDSCSQIDLVAARNPATQDDHPVWHR